MRLLIVEDEVKIARALSKVFTSEGYAVDIEHDSTAGYAMASTEPYDGLIIDRMLPGEYDDGVAMLQALRKAGISTPALLLTALGETEQKTEGLDAGADDYVTKPFAVDELLARVRALLRRPQQQQSNILKAKSIKLDTINRTASLRNKPLELTVKEFALLEYLMRSAGRVVSKEQIIAHVWNFDADILPNTVEVYIKYLRNKIDKAGGPSIIKTVRGVGYTIEG
ncbi:response regulator transcription factor [Candidatus Saccharibacteria bacterium]|jgi:two component transcriptional regulator, winged helix family protein|nr:response regulator transcription factor [Candidatus Saccharibacteria bacterium]